MKKSLFIVLLCFMLLLLCSCSKSEFMQLSGFVSQFNDAAQEKEIDFSIIEATTMDDDETLYTIPFKDGDDSVLLRLVADSDKKIKQCRIIMPKCDKHGKKLAKNEERMRLFSDITEKTICAFTFSEPTSAKDISGQFGLNEQATFSDEGELTKDEGSFHYVYLSTPLCCEFIIYNRWLCEIETTNKPESKTAFGDNTSIRTQTVPLT